MVQLALHSALSDRAAAGRVAVVDAWSFEQPKTKEARTVLRSLGLEGQGRVLIVLDRGADDAARSFRNLPDVELILNSELNAYDVLCSDWVVFTRSTLPGVTTATTEPATPPATAEAPQAGPEAVDWDAPLRDSGEEGV
jgi:large subunit ribosomal protein L4